MKYFIYARKSTDDEERQILSIQAQLDELRMLAKKDGLHVVHEYVEAQTAKEPGRPIFNEMLAAMEKGDAQGILARLKKRPHFAHPVFPLVGNHRPKSGCQKMAVSSTARAKAFGSC
jgi:hypothetical protein